MQLCKSMIAASLLVFSTMLTTTAAQAQEANQVNITADENGNGTIEFVGGGTFEMPGALAADPGPGGLSSALTYNLLNPPSLIGGDVILSELVGEALVPSDVIRFLSGPEVFVFYSDNGDGSDALADTGLPTAFFTNVVTLAEVGPEGSNGAFYTPTANQPGFVPGFAVTYHFISDSAVPEPATWAMMLIGFGAVGVTLRRRKRTQPAFG